MRTWIKQGVTRTCGQIAVAVAAGVPLTQVLNYIGHMHGSTTKELIRALKHFGLKCDTKCRVLKEKPKFALAQVHSPRKPGWHWIVVEGNKIYDGAFGRANGTVDWPSGFRITSYLEIFE